MSYLLLALAINVLIQSLQDYAIYKNPKRVLALGPGVWLYDSIFHALLFLACVFALVREAIQ